MCILDLLKDQGARWKRGPSAAESVLRSLLAISALDLPEDHPALLRFSNDGEGELGIQPGWFRFWPAPET
jgi:hypothetical protein